MAITLLTGRVGSGKSYDAVVHSILPAVLAGRPVRTNVAVDVEAFKRYVAANDGDADKVDLVVADVRAMPEGRPAKLAEGQVYIRDWIEQLPDGALCVLDESWRFWQAGATVKQLDPAEVEWFAMHRHRASDKWAQEIVLIVQQATTLASYVRGLVDRTIRHESLRTALGKFGANFYVGTVFKGCPVRESDAEVLSRFKRKFDKAIFKAGLYHTSTQGSSTGGKADEHSTDQRGIGRVWTIGLLILLGLAFVAACGLLVVWLFKSMAVPEGEAAADGEPAGGVAVVDVVGRPREAAPLADDPVRFGARAPVEQLVVGQAYRMELIPSMIRPAYGPRRFKVKVCVAGGGCGLVQDIQLPSFRVLGECLASVGGLVVACGNPAVGQAVDEVDQPRSSREGSVF